MSKIAITGSNGTVGRALAPRLSAAHEVVPIDLPDVDIRDTKKLARAMRGADAVIHLAGVFGPAAEGKENWRSPHRDPVNSELFAAALTAAQQAGVKLFVHASSIHVEDTLTHLRQHPGELLVAQPQLFRTEPSSGYGQSKREQEAVLEANAPVFENGAVSLRFGGVTRTGRPLASYPDAEILGHEHRVWLGHNDLGSLALNIIEQHNTPDYDVLYAVSSNDGSFHDTANQYNWEPQANSAAYTQ